MRDQDFGRMYDEEKRWAALQRPPEYLMDLDPVPFIETNVTSRTYFATIPKPLTWQVVTSLQLGNNVAYLQFNDILRIRDGTSRPNSILRDILEVRMINGNTLRVDNLRVTLETSGDTTPSVDFLEPFGIFDTRLTPYTSSGTIKADQTIDLWYFLELLTTSQNNLYLHEEEGTALVAGKVIRVYLDEENYADIYQKLSLIHI